MRLTLVIGGAVVSVAAGGLAAHFALRRLPEPLAGAVRALSEELSSAGEGGPARLVDSACHYPKDPCACAAIAATQGLDFNLGPSTVELLGRFEDRCRGNLPLRGMKAEALARVGRYEEARHEAEAVLKVAPSDAHANLALGLVAFTQTTLKESEGYARKALEAGRGIEARRLLGRIAVSRGKFGDALPEFQAVLAARPSDMEAAYSVAMAYTGLRRYNEAREGFLRVLRIDPKHVEARFNLALMSLQVGARMDAAHHIEKLEEIAPGDPRIAELKAALANPRGTGEGSATLVAPVPAPASSGAPPR